ncbi:MAG: TIR domain-containing protein [Paraglaciecola sp.]|uniref:TIR domain-containing protein n=1 Tax=Paraglaciecola sp. TaxID=1920173 RepID=UPI003297749C
MLPARVFISYAHANEEHKNDFCKFLSTLKRNNEISEWNDRKLDTGSKLHEEIISNLEEADIVCLLITQDFLNSYYCVEEELARALKQARSNNTKIFPIIVDHCMWLDTEIREYTCIPEDGTPITDFQNQNKGWKQVTDQLKNVVQKLKSIKKPLLENKDINIELDEKYLLSNSFTDFLNSTEINFQHPYKNIITLEDIYVYPDFKVVQDELHDYEITKNSDFFSEYENIPQLSLILGEEQSGKTSFSKRLFSSLVVSGHIPIYLDGSDLNSSDLDKVIEKTIEQQYSTLNVHSLKQCNEYTVLILDNINEAKLNTKSLSKFLQGANKHFSKIVIVSDDSIQYKEDVVVLFEDFEWYELLPFGYERRDELLKVWYSIGRVEYIEDSDLIEIVDSASSQLDTIIRKNIVPPKPLFILMIVQTLESAQSQDYSLTSHGYCYQILIQESLKKAKIKANEIDKYINYLTHLAFHMFNSESTLLTNNEIKKFQTIYSNKFHIRAHKEVLENLQKSKLIKTTDESIEFKYRYIFYFYVAKYMADNEQALMFVDKLCDTLHMEQSSNILIFITHHTRSKSVIDKIIQRTTSVFANENEAELGTEETEFLKEFLDEIPELVLKERNNVLEARKQRFQEKDRQEAAILEKDQPYNLDEDETEEISQYLRDVSRSVKSVEIIGQIIKSRHASIEVEQLNQLATEAINVGLRFLSFYLTSTKNIKTELVEIIYKFIQHQSELSDEKIVEMSKQSFIQMIYSLSFNVIKKISTSIGHRELIDLFNKLNTKTLTPAYSLINANIQLEFKSNKKSIPRKELETISKSLNGKFLAERLLKTSILQFQYLNFVSYKDKAWISEKLDIPLEAQEKVTGKKSSKLLPKK